MASTSRKIDDGDLTVDSSVGSHPLAIEDSVSDKSGNQGSKKEANAANRDATSAASIASSQPRPNYFDLQRLAAASASHAAEGPLVDRDRLRRQGKERERSDSISHAAMSHSAASSSFSTSSQASDDDVEEMGDELDTEDEGIPRWINAATANNVPNRRPHSRNSIFSTVPPKSNRESLHSYPHRSLGVSSRNSMRSPPPGPSSFGTMVPPSRVSTPHKELDMAGKEDNDGISLGGGKASSRQFLVSLHLMTDDELDRHLGMSVSPLLRPNASPLQTQGASMSERSNQTASHSKFSGLLSTSPRSESPHAYRSTSSLAVMESSKDLGEDAAQSRQRHKIVRELSLRLEASSQENERSKRTLEQEKDRLLFALSAAKKESQAREDALKEVLLSMGVSTARVERTLVQATSQAQVPVFRADERVAGSFSSASKAKETEQLLPQSLREAMLEDIDGSGEDSNRAFSIAVRSGSLKVQEDDARNASPSSSRVGVASDMSTPSGRASRSAWGSGLVSWSRTGPTSKKASASIQATSPAAVEADGYFSDTPGRDARGTPSPSPQRRPSQISRSSSISAVMSQLRGESDEGEEGDEEDEREGRSGWADTASRGALGLLGSLAWRRKKPDRNRTIRRRDAQVRPPATAAVEPDGKDSVVRDKDSASIKSSQTRRSSVSSRKQSVPEEQRQEDTIRARLTLARPQAQYTMSGRDVISALYEAIGSAPVSPETEKKQPFLATADLPKPAHFKAICLATRIMTPDAGSILSNGGKEASPLVKESGMALVKGARDEGKVVTESSGSGASKGGRESSSITTPIAREKSVAENRDARAAPPSKPVANGASSTTATLSKALGKYSKQTPKFTEPNVTRLPHLFGLSNATSTSASQESVMKEGANAKAAKEAPLVTELEPIFAHDVKPPTLALSARRSLFIPSAAPLRKRRNTQDSLGRVSEGEESSGDEFEVYGGKHLHADDKKLPRRRESGVDDALLTDRYGFVYDATPADVRLLRRARKEATHAPACLTGIRVGVRARGGTDSQSDDDKDDADLVGADSESDAEDKGEAAKAEIIIDGVANGQDSDNASQKTVSSHKTAGTGGGAAGSSAVGLLTVKPGKAVAQASTLSAASQSSSAPGPTCPAQERLHFEGQGVQVAPAAAAGSSQRRPPSTSQTVRRLLGQLQEMHNDQQTSQQNEWDDFLKRRRANNRDGKLETTHDTSSKSSSSAFSRFEASALSEEEWHLGGIVGLNRMGTESKDYQDFIRLLYKGIPLVYRPKIWYECSGAMELNEPGKYQELLKDHENEENQCTNQIDLDIGRTMPTNVFFSGDGPGVPKLRRLLVAFSWFNPKCGYCQGMNNLAATLLLTHATEEDAFWVLVSIIEKILPEEYYTSHLLVSQADQRVLMDLMDELLPDLAAHIRDLGVDLPAVTFAWFLSLYTDCLPVETLFRVWDVMFVEGMIVLFRVAMAIFTIHEKELLQTSSPSAFYSFVHGMTSHLFSVDRLIKLACEDLKPTVRREMILERREKHAKDLTIELGLDTPAT